MENEKIEKYKLVAIKKKHSTKSNKDYYIAYVLFENNYSVEVLNVLIQEKQVGHLSQVIGDDSFDLSQFIKLDYNIFTKRYDLKIIYGL